MNLRDADSGKILWQSSDDMYVAISLNVVLQIHCVFSYRYSDFVLHMS